MLAFNILGAKASEAPSEGKGSSDRITSGSELQRNMLTGEPGSIVSVCASPGCEELPPKMGSKGFTH